MKIDLLKVPRRAAVHDNLGIFSRSGLGALPDLINAPGGGG